MEANRKAARYSAAAFALLCAVSAYRQYGIHFSPDDRVRPVVVYAVYLLLIAAWWIAIQSRVTQKNMRGFLCGEDAVILVWMTVRFLQDFWFIQTPYLMRVSGYLVVVPLVLMPLLGFYAALGLGKAETYRMDRRWYLLLLPALGLIALMLTNELHHAVFRVLPGETEANVYFHANWGIFMLLAWALALELLRLGLIYRKGRAAAEHSLLRFAPCAIAGGMLLFCIPYLIAAFVVRFELIEFTAALAFLEAMMWESCILLGMIPVNTQYEQVFDRSTVGMRIVTEDGATCVKSGLASDLPPELFRQLKRDGTVLLPRGLEMHLYPLQSGYLVWQKDVTQIRGVIADLRKSAEGLEQESALLGEELRVRSEEARLQTQNRIYDRLTEEMGGQLALMRELLKKQAQAEDKTVPLRRLCLLGTYVKRRCNLRLIEQSDGQIPMEDLELSFRDLLDDLERLGTRTELRWSGEAALSAQFGLYCFDMLECLLEYERFAPAGVQAELTGTGAFSIRVVPAENSGARRPAEELGPRERGTCHVRWQTTPDGYRADLWEAK